MPILVAAPGRGLVRTGSHGTALTRRVGALLASLLLATTAVGEQVSVYRVRGKDARLFDQYDNDGYSLSVAAAGEGALEMTVRVSDSPLQSDAAFPTGAVRDVSLTEAPERDAMASRLASGCRSQAEAVEKVLLGVAEFVRYDTDRLRRQDPSSVFASRRAHCVGLSELAVDLLRRLGIHARTVQGILRTAPERDGYVAAIGGAYHRWIEVFYPDRGFVFSDPSASINGVDARYIPFTRRSLARPDSLSIEPGPITGELFYPLVRAGDAMVRVRPLSR